MALKYIFPLAAVHLEQKRGLKGHARNACCLESQEVHVFVFLNQPKPNTEPRLWGWQKTQPLQPGRAWSIIAGGRPLTSVCCALVAATSVPRLGPLTRGDSQHWAECGQASGLLRSCLAPPLPASVNIFLPSTLPWASGFMKWV